MLAACSMALGQWQPVYLKYTQFKTYYFTESLVKFISLHTLTSCLSFDYKLLESKACVPIIAFCIIYTQYINNAP